MVVAAALEARGALLASAASAAGITSEEGGNRVSSLTPPASRATAAAAGSAASTRSPATETTQASGRGCRRLGLRASFPCFPGNKLYYHNVVHLVAFVDLETRI